MKRFLLITALFASGAMAQVRIPGPGGSAAPAASGGSSYAHEYTITLGNSSQIPASQSNFTVLVCANMTLGNGNACATATGLEVTGSGGYVANASGYDIIFSSTVCSSPTSMSWEVPSYTGSTGAMEAWVLVPSLAATGTFYMCVGNSSISTFQGGTAGAEWDSYTAAVWHFPNGTAISGTDSSANGNNLTVSGSGVTAGAGQIDGGPIGTSTVWTLDKTSGVTNIPATNVAQTMSVWFTVNSLSFLGTGFLLTNGSSNGNALNIANGTIEWQNWGGSTVANYTSIPATGVWHQAVFSANGSGTTCSYLDGSLIGSCSSYTLQTGSPTQIYVSTYDGHSQPWNGDLDEIHVASTQRSANWIATEHNNQSAPASFMSIALAY
jgi:hypothetical protein